MIEIMKKIFSQPKLTAVTLDLIIPVLLYLSLMNEKYFAAWICLGLIIAARMLVAVKG